MEIEVSKYDKNLMASKKEALDQSGLKEIPAKDNGESIYILAIGLVKKRDGSVNYALLRKNLKGEDEVYADFGHVCTMSAILEVYPYEYLDDMYMPLHDMDEKTTAKTKREIIQGLRENGELPDDYTKEFISKMKVADMNGLLIGIGCKRQLDAMRRKKESEAREKAMKAKMAEEEKQVEKARNDLMQGIVPQGIVDANENEDNKEQQENEENG